MEKFDTFMSRHGEHGVQAVLENWERFNGITYTSPVTLECRWAHFLGETETHARVAA